MPDAPVSLGTQVGKKIIGVIVALVGLLIIRAIVGGLPMLKTALSIGTSGVTPLMIAVAIANTLIFVVLLRFGFGLSAVLRAGSPGFPESGAIFNLMVVTVVAIWANSAYSELGQALLRDNQEYYGWVFLGLIVAPLVGVIVLVTRNMHTITDVLYRAVRGPE